MNRFVLACLGLACIVMADLPLQSCGTAETSGALLPEPPLPADLENYDERVIERLRSAAEHVRESPSSALAWGELGMIYEVERMRGLALVCYQQARLREPEVPKWWYRSAICHWRQGEIDAALQAIAETIRLSPSYAPAYYRHGTFQLETGELASARESFARAMELDQEYFGGWLGTARVLLLEERSAEAIEILERLREEDPSDRSVVNVLAAAYREAGRDPESTLPTSALPEDEELGRHWNDPWEDEIRELRRVPEMLQAGTMVARGNGEEAIPILERLRDERPAEIQILLQLSEAYAQADRLQEARRTYRTILDVDPDHVLARIGLARLREREGERAVALQLLDEILARQPDYGPALAEKARILYEGQQYEQAIPWLVRALEVDQRNPELWFWLGWSQLTLRLWEDAREAFQNLLERSPERGDAWLALAKAQVKLDQLDEAEKALQRAEEIGVETPRLLQEVAQALERARAQEGRREGEGEEE